MHVHGSGDGYMPKDEPGRKAAPRPTVGRIVHYVSYGTPGGEYGSECRAAVVTAAGRGLEEKTWNMEATNGGDTAQEVDLCVLNPEGMFFNRGVSQDEPTKRGGTWHWPEREG
jgi:hypothetical protein